MNELSRFPHPRLVAVNGIELEVFEAGRENAGNPIVLCHGWPELAYSWRYQIPALVAAGYHVIAPNQRGYGGSSRPADVTSYDITHLTHDLVGLLDHFGYDDAVFMGHDWGAIVVWNLAMLHPGRVSRVINLAVPYQVRRDVPWVDFMQAALGDDYYIVHFNRKPGVADAVLNANTARFLRNIYRKNLRAAASGPDTMMINLALSDDPLGDPIMSDDDLQVFVDAFERSGFTSSINWYRNLDRNWRLIDGVEPVLQQPALVIYGDDDIVPKSDRLLDFVPKADVRSFACGHWIQQEMPEQTNRAVIDWLQATSV